MKKRGIIFILLSIGLVYGWNSNGNPVCDAAESQLFPKVVSDSSGGMICCFEDMRPDSSAGYEVYAQRLTANGIRLWGTDSNGIVVSYPQGSHKYGHRLNSVICEGNAGEAIICWVNHHNLKPWYGDTTGIYTQKVKNGQIQWKRNPSDPTPLPIPITSASKNPPSIASDGYGGVICAWMQFPTSSDSNYYVKATRLNANGMKTCAEQEEGQTFNFHLRSLFGKPRTAASTGS